MIEPCNYRISVKGLATDDAGRILLIRGSDNIWELPGGGLEHGEDPTDGLRREIMEEMGIEVTEISASPRYFVTAAKLRHAGYTANVIYDIKLAHLDFVPSDECQEPGTTFLSSS